jgi:hypothetical protein
MTEAASPNARTTATEIIRVPEGAKAVDAKAFQSEIMNMSLKRGIIGFATTMAASGVASVFAYKHSHFYQTKMAPSARLGIPLMASMFIGSVIMEVTMMDAHRNPGDYGIQGIRTDKAEHKSLPPHQWLVNRIADKPFYFVTLMGAPLAGNIIYTRMHQPHLSISQALLQSRVMAQGGILSIVLTVMAAKFYVDKNGKFEEE